jgi:hypothetical protein
MHFFSGHASFVGKEVSALHGTMQEWMYRSICNIKPDTRWYRLGREGTALQAGMLLVGFPIISLE